MTEKDVKEVTEVAKQKLKESGNIYFDHILAYISYLESQIENLEKDKEQIIFESDLKIKALEDNIEKMKCCQNCKYCGACNRACNNWDKWEIYD